MANGALRLFPRCHPWRRRPRPLGRLCHRNPLVYQVLVELAQWMVETINFDGFRFDFVKGHVPWMVQSIAELRHLKKSVDNFYTFCVGECWDDERTVDDWLGEVNSYTDNPVSAFDFPQHYRLKDLCDTHGFSLSTLATPGTVVQDTPSQAVTFVDNHDTIRDPGNAINNDKLLAYSFILTNEGYPSAFWMDWYNLGPREGGYRMELPHWWPPMSRMPVARRKPYMPMTPFT